MGATVDQAGGARVCGHALAAGAALPLCFAWLGLWLLLGRYHGLTDAFGHVAPWVLLTLGALGVTLPTVFGFAAISCIKGSEGRRTGMPLAVAAAFAAPVMLLAVFIVQSARFMVRSMAYDLPDKYIPVVMAATALIGIPGTIWLSVWIYRTGWRWASGAQAPKRVKQERPRLCKLPLSA